MSTALKQPAGSSADEMAVSFARVLRGAGISVPIDSVITFVQALDVVSMTKRDDVYWAGRATLVHRPEDQQLFDRAFAVFWERRNATDVDEDGPPQKITLLLDDEHGPNENNADAQDDNQTMQMRFTANESLRSKDFAQYTDEELHESQRLMHQLRLAGPPRQSLRLTYAKRSGSRNDLRRTVRASLAFGGEPAQLHWRKPSERQRRLVVLLDISGSMEPYARALLRFMHAAVVGRQRVEAFTFGTRLTRLTKELNSRDPDKALTRAAAQVPDWSGGTRLGESLRKFNATWGVRGMARGAIVVVLSDGWDRGDPSVLAEQMQRLQRVAFRVVWVNPLKVTPGYAPHARGMAAALPYVDDFVEGHSIQALEHLTRVISRD
jgi:uncharacterized protein with von Willebrand factor type A (vWA) domain